MPKKIFLLPILLFAFTCLYAQSNENEVGDENEFTHLVSTKDVVYQLRKNYGVHGSVLLSKTLAQIVNSFSNQQQAVNTWQSAINDLSEEKPSSQISLVNSTYHYGQILSQYTHGMNQAKWFANRLDFKVTDKTLKSLFNTYDDLTLYFKLPQIWEILLMDIAKQENIQWHKVFENSLDLFPDEKSEESKNKSVAELKLFSAITQWQNTSELEDKLADLMVKLDGLPRESQSFYQATIRFILKKNELDYLTASMSWLNISSHLFLNKAIFTPKQQQELAVFIEENDTWFLSKEQELLAVNTQLPEVLETSFHQLKALYSSDDKQLDVNLASIYQLFDAALGKYMSIPFRNKIRKDLEVCLNISEENLPFPQEPIDKNQFEGCAKDISYAAIYEATSRELSGSLTKIGSQDALDRALQSPPWQSINILYANITSTQCLEKASQIPNPLEWALAAESMLWFADRWPAYLKAYPQNQQLIEMVQQGQQIIHGFDCLGKSKTEIMDTSFKQILGEWQNVRKQITLVANEFNQTYLIEGSDIDLIDIAEKPSNYRTIGTKISACDAQNSCGVHVQLEPTRALYGLFPNHLLVAEQLKLGTLKICYDDVGWENRRTTSTHLDNDNVANYLGNFSFSLKGYYDDELVFNKKLIDKDEYLYLFAANTEEVLSTSCPLGIIGTKISTKLARGTYGLVPNRLTFLTASRADESSILAGNWESGAEWNNAITTADIPLIEENKLEKLKSSIQLSYQQKATHLQESIYKSLLDIQENPSPEQQNLASSFAAMQRNSNLFSSLNYLLQMNNLMTSDRLHGLLFGNQKIADKNTIQELFENQLNINLLIENIDANLQTNQEKWNALAKSWSNQHILDILFRLNSLIE